MPGSTRVGGEHAAVGPQASGDRSGRSRRTSCRSATRPPGRRRSTGRRTASRGRAPAAHGSLAPMSAPYAIRIVGDPVLRQRAHEVTEIDGRLVKLTDDMFETMYDAPGVGLAAPQVGVQKRFFVYDLQARRRPPGADQPAWSPSPTASGSSARAACRSPACTSRSSGRRQIHVTGLDLDGNEVEFEADEYLARRHPARDRPPRRRAAARAPRRRDPQGGQEGGPGDADGHRDRRPRRANRAPSKRSFFELR